MAGADMPQDEVLVAIITWNSAAVLPHLLNSLPSGLEGVARADVVAFDNASGDSTCAVAGSAGLSVVNTGANLGYAGAVNVAYAHARPNQHVLILNPDVRLESGSIAALLEALREPGVGMAVPRVLREDGSLDTSLRRFPTPARAWGEAILGGALAGRFHSLGATIRDPREYENPGDVEWASGAAVLVSADCRRRLGLWDPTFFLYSEETEYMLRARTSGIRVRFVPDAVVRHRGGDMARLPHLWRLQVRNRIALNRRRGGLANSLAFQAGVVANEALRAGSALHRAGLAAAIQPHAVEAGPARGLVVFAGVDWWCRNRAHPDVQIARRVAQERPVLMVNRIGSRGPIPGQSTKARDRIRRKATGVVRLVRTPISEQPNFHVMTPLSLPSRHEWLRRASDGFVRFQVQMVTHWFLLAQPHILVTIPNADRVVEGMPKASLTFERSDLSSCFPEADRADLAQMEHRLLERSDLVVYVSRELMQQDTPVVGSRGHFLGQGVDAELFKRVPHERVPDDLRCIPRPRAGCFAGLDADVIDFDLIEALAHRLPSVQVVLIGDASSALERIDPIPNVHWLGDRPHETLPAYGSGFDVGLMPWLDNDGIHRINPVRLGEYLALGLPVVSTGFVREADQHRDVVRVATDQESFIAAVVDALTASDDADERARRRDRVVRNTWDTRAQALLQLMDSLAWIPKPGTGLDSVPPVVD